MSRDTAHAQYDFWPKHVLNNAFGRYNELNNSKHLIFGTLLNIGKPEQQKDKFSLKGVWPGSHDPYKNLAHPQTLSKMSKAKHLKFGTRMHMNNLYKMKTKNSQMRRGLGHVTFINSGIL